MILREKFVAKGHENIKATHRSTIEITKEEHVTPRGDCIIAVSSEKALTDLDPMLKDKIRSGWYVATIFKSDDIIDHVIGRGDPRLTLRDPVRIIIRKSDFIDDKTLMIRSDKAAIDLDRRLVSRLKDRKSILEIEIIVSESLKELKEVLKKDYIY
ncbi:MAG: DUF371 domain-containing protein [Desulfurococcales archaeon]|jgi:hypothetical protein|nr:DUF371 domain-containing protein [Desulfurococcales archaeon]MCC6061405.1 DUF371 domain-containing protein [Desulfurococcales archaeon]MCI4456520.1 DUF371 domain-containing protein [Desulfurococcaceae archaeon]